MQMIGSTNIILFRYGQIILNMGLFILEYTPAVRISIEFAFNNRNRNTLTRGLVVLKGRLQSLLRMCDRFVMKSLLITSFQSHGVNENTRGRLNRSLLYCKERWRIKSWHKNCCFESFKIKQLMLDSGNAENRVA